MSNKVKQEMNRIEIPKELSARSIIGIHKAKKEMQKSRKAYSLASIGLVATLIISIGAFALFKNNDLSPNGTTNNQNKPIVAKSDGVKIPPIQLPKGNSKADMIGLIVYNGKVYIEDGKTEIDAENAKSILGEKLGTTKGHIEERSNLLANKEEFASTIGKGEGVYSVKGYDKNFRIMTYGERGGKPYAKFYENLNGITIKNGEDVFSKLKMAGNITSAKYVTYNEWDHNVNLYHPIADLKVVNDFVEELNKTRPILNGENSPLIKARNNQQEDFRELSIHLKDGTKVKLIVLKGGYIYYGYMDVYFKMNDDIFSKMWGHLE